MESGRADLILSGRVHFDVSGRAAFQLDVSGRAAFQLEVSGMTAFQLPGFGRAESHEAAVVLGKVIGAGVGKMIIFPCGVPMVGHVMGAAVGVMAFLSFENPSFTSTRSFLTFRFVNGSAGSGTPTTSSAAAGAVGAEAGAGAPTVGSLGGAGAPTTGSEVASADAAVSVPRFCLRIIRCLANSGLAFSLT